MRIDKRQSRGKAIVWVLLLLILIGAAYAVYHFKFKKKPEPVPTSSPTPVVNNDEITIGVDSRPTAILVYAVNYYIPGKRFKVKPVIIEDHNQRWLRMAAGDIDMAIAGLPEFVLGAARHNPGSIIAFLSSSRGNEGIVVRKDVGGIEDVKAKNISAVPGSSSHYFLIKVLDSQGKSTAEINFIPSPQSKDVLKRFNEGDFLTGAALPEPYLSKAVTDKNRLFASTKRAFSITEVLVAGDDVLKNRSKDVQAVVNAYYQLVDYINANPGLAKTLIVTRSGRSVEEVDFLFSRVKLKALAEARAPSRDSVLSAMKKIKQIWSVEGLPNADGAIDYDKALLYEYMQRAVITPSESISDDPSGGVIITPTETDVPSDIDENPIIPISSESPTPEPSPFIIDASPDNSPTSLPSP